MATEYTVTIRNMAQISPFAPWFFFGVEATCLLTVESFDFVGLALALVALASSAFAIWIGYWYTKKRSSTWRFVLMRLFGLWCGFFLFAFAIWATPHYATSNKWIYSDYFAIYAGIWCASLIGSVLYELANKGLTTPFFLAITKFDSKELDFVMPKSKEASYSSAILFALWGIATIKLGFPDGGIYAVFVGSLFLAPYLLCTALLITRRIILQ